MYEWKANNKNTGETVYGDLLERNDKTYLTRKEMYEDKIEGKKVYTSTVVEVDKSTLSKLLDEKRNIYKGDVIILPLDKKYEYLGADLVFIEKESDIPEGEFELIGNIYEDEYLKKEMYTQKQIKDYHIHTSLDVKNGEIYFENGASSFKIMHKGAKVIVIKYDNRSFHEIVNVDNFERRLKNGIYIKRGKWGKWQDLKLDKRFFPGFEILNVFKDFKFRARDREEVELKAYCYTNKKVIKTRSKIAEGDKFSLNTGIEICLVKLLKKYLDTLVKEY